VNPDEVLKSAAEFDADIIALSALMLTSLPSVKDVIDRLNQLEKYKHRFKLMVGGGSVTAEWAQTAGVDGYGRDAVEAVQVARKLLGLT
jgi:methanogenic corrinoid protein MtbC1